MSRIRGKDTRPEMVVRRGLRSMGFRYSLHSRRLPGCPDLVLRRYHTVSPADRRKALERLASTLRRNVEPESIHPIPLSVRKLSLEE